MVLVSDDNSGDGTHLQQAGLTMDPYNLTLRPYGSTFLDIVQAAPLPPGFDFHRPLIATGRAEIEKNPLAWDENKKRAMLPKI